jgi:hypothetical protein
MMQDQSSQVKLVLYWAIAVVPLIWGVYHTVLNALKLFS